MKCRFVRVWLVLVCVVAFPFRSPAPLIYRPGEGWVYEPVGGEGKWQQPRAKDQLEVAQAAFDKKAYSLAIKAARRVVVVWPLSDYAPRAQYLVARAYDESGQDEKAFKEYQKVLEKYPKIANYDEILQRQSAITDRYLAGKWFKVLGYIPLFPSMDRTANMYAKIVKNGPYSDVAPQAQLKIGQAREKQSEFPLAVRAYEQAADRYHDRTQVAADALYRAGVAYDKQARTAEYDQNTAAKAIAAFTDFMALYPNDPRVPAAQQYIAGLKREQARGSFETAQFYEKYRRWSGALVYYNEVRNADPGSPYAAQALERIEVLKKRVAQSPPK